MSDEHLDGTPPGDARENVNERVSAAESGVLSDVVSAVAGHLEGVVATESFGQTVFYARPGEWLELGRVLHEELDFEMCVDVCGVDHLLNPRRPVPEGVVPERFEVVANFLSLSRNRRVRAVCEVPAADAAVPSLTSLFPGVEYSERETWDLLGIRFDGHPDLTRILLPDDWEGHPLRKDDAAARVPVQFKAPAVTPDQQSLGTPPGGGGS